MKKNKAITLMLLAFASAAAVSAAGCKDGHVHNWVQKTDGSYHWMECDGEGCDATKDFGAHADVKNNETNAEVPDGKCDVCGADVHIHSYEWKSDAEKHWQQCLLNEAEKINFGGHIDLKNSANENTPDHVCDTCGFVEKIKISFETEGLADVGGQTIDWGTSAAKPQDPAAEGYTFGGWYKDAEFKTEFDFTAKLEGDTAIYAKWVPLETAGSNVHTAVAVPVTATETSATFGEFSKLYYKVTADEKGRYSVYLGSGKNSEACKFTASNDGYKTEYASDATMYFDLDAGETLYVCVIRGEGIAADGEVKLAASVVINEPLSDSWLMGEYTNGTDSLVLAKEDDAVTATFGENACTELSYIGGSFDTLTFGYDFYGTALKFTLKREAYGKFTMTRVSPSEETLGEFVYYDKANDIPVEKFAGVYVCPKTAGGEDDGLPGLTEICIWENGNGYYILDGDQVTCDMVSTPYACNYNQKINTLRYFGFRFTLNTDATGKVTGLNVAQDDGTTKVYALTDKVVDEYPENLPLKQTAEYAGSLNIGIMVYGPTYQTWIGQNNGYGVNVIAYSKATGVYSVKCGDTVYKVKIEGVEGDDESNAVIKFYDSSDNLLDTLTAFDGYKTDNNLPSAATTLDKSDFKRNYRHYTVQTAGWYKFTSDDENLKVYYDLDASDPVSDSAPFADLSASGAAVYLEAGSIVGVSIAGYEYGAFESTAFTVASATAPKGASEANPHTFTGIGSHEVENLSEKYSEYVEVTLPAAGKYLVSVNASVAFKVNGTAAEGACAAFAVTADNLKIKLEITAADSLAKLVITVEDDFTAVTPLTFDENSEGSLSAATAVGYAKTAGEKTTYLEDDYDYATGVKFVSDKQFKILLNGTEVEAEKVETPDPAPATTKTVTYEFTANLAQVKHGFKVMPAADSTVNYAITYSQGARLNPHKVEKLGTAGADYTGKDYYFAFTADKDKDCVLAIGEGFFFTVAGGDGTKYGYSYNAETKKYEKLENTQLKVAAGEKVTVVVSAANAESKTGKIALIANYDFTSVTEATALTQGEPTADGTHSCFAFLELNYGSNIYYFEELYEDAVITGFYSFKVYMADGTVLDGTKSSTGAYEVKVPAGTEVRFDISSKSVQGVMLYITCHTGSEHNPAEADVSKTGSFTYKATSAGDKYISLSGGLYTSTANITLDGKDYKAGDVFEASKGSVAIWKARANASITITPALPEGTALGTYKYFDSTGANTIVFTENTVLKGGKIYHLVSSSNSKMTFSDLDEKEPEKITISSEGGKLYVNGAELTYVPVFNEVAAQEYTCDIGLFDLYGFGDPYWMDEYVLTLVLEQDGSGTFGYSGKEWDEGQTLDITDLKRIGNVFTFVWGTASDNSFEFVENDGKYSIHLIKLNQFEDFVMTPKTEITSEPYPADGGSEEAGTLEAASYKFENESGVLFTITVSEDLTKVKYEMVAEDDSLTIDEAELKFENGVYSFEYDYDDWGTPAKATVTFAVNFKGELVVKTVRGYFIFDDSSVFKKQGPKVYGTLTAGTFTYTDEDASATYTLIVNEDLTAVSYQGPNNEEPMADLELVKSGNTYTFDYEIVRKGQTITQTVTFAVNEDGSLELSDSGYDLSKVQFTKN